MFARRNSATLIIIWIILLGVGIFWYMKDTNRLAAAIEQQKSSKRLLEESQKEIKRLTQVETIHEDVSHQWRDRPKRIISAEEPSFTLSYLNWIMQTNNLNIYYDFVLNSKNKKGDVTQFIYTLTGEGNYRDINKMLWLITYEPILYIIESINLKKNSDNSEYVEFSIKLKGFTVDSKTDVNEDFTESHFNLDEIYTAGIDIFQPLVVQKPVERKTAIEEKPTLPAKLPGQIDVEKASLKAVTANSIFLTEGSSGLKELKLGDEVYLGKLVNINQTRNEAEFIITKFGRSQRVVLTIDQRN